MGSTALVDRARPARRGPTGSPEPVRIIGGRRTRLGCNSHGCPNVAITIGTDGLLYAAVSGAGPTRIEVFGRPAHGDAAPLRTIAGLRTGLASPNVFVVFMR